METIKKIAFILIALLLTTYITLVLFGVSSSNLELIFAIIMIILVGSIFVIKKYSKDTVKDDEMSENLIEKAAARSFFVSPVLLLLAMYQIDAFDEARIAFSLCLAGMGILFVINYLYIRITMLK